MKKIQKKNITINYLKQIYLALRTYNFNENGKKASLTDFSNMLAKKDIKDASRYLALYVIGTEINNKDVFNNAVEKFGAQINHILGANLSKDKSRFEKYYLEFKTNIA